MKERGSGMKVIDLTVTLNEKMDVYPGDPAVTIEKVHTYDKNGWELRKLTLGTHTGTHVDAFSHMHKGKANLDEMPIERFFGEAQVVQIDAQWPREIGLFFTEPLDETYIDKLLHAKPSFVGGDMTERLERMLLANDIITYTDLINLEKIPFHQTFTFYGLPLKIEKGDGSPVRAIAIL